PGWLTRFDPLIHVHWPPLYFQRSLRNPQAPVESRPLPPNSQTFPLASVQAAYARAPGMLPAAAVPWVPYVPGSLIRFGPLIHVHRSPLYFQRSLKNPYVPVESIPQPPKSQKSPVVSVQVAAPSRAPGVLSGAAVPWVPYVPAW